MPNQTPETDSKTPTTDALAQHSPSIARIVAGVSEQWAEHATFIERRFANDDPAFLSHCESLADDILQLTGENLAEYCADYRWMCDEFVKEEIFFRRNKRYRLSTLREAQESVYDNPEFMKRYMFGLLISQILWRNHASVFDSYLVDFLGPQKQTFRHLEVGPGHGLFLHHAANHPLCEAAHGWDISDTSLGTTEHALSALKSDHKVKLERRDIAQDDTHDHEFDTVVASELLEHVEQPESVLDGLIRVMRPGGQIFINVPVNSPAPDHIYLWTSPGDVIAMIENAGLEVIRSHQFPATGVSLEQARKARLTISTVIIGRRPN